jgi:hypothetical protein
MAMGVVGCVIACGATEEQLRTRAAFDMQCSEQDLRVVWLDERTAGVRGCGQQGTYVETCPNLNKTDCTWVLNTDSQSAR